MAGFLASASSYPTEPDSATVDSTETTPPERRTSDTSSGRDFAASYPEYAITRRLDELRAREYAYLDADGHTYLDYTGSGLPADAQVRAHATRVRGTCFGNPHSENPTSSAATELVERTREAVLAYFSASPSEYVAIFTPNATGACRLVGEAYPFRAGSRCVLTADNHNSVNGIREFARRRGAALEYVPVRPPELRIDDDELRSVLTRTGIRARLRSPGHRRGLFVFPAQSNFTGVQHPLSWVDLAHEHGYDVLLDAAAFVPTNRLDLSTVHPDFVPVSWYKVFGYPTGVGCLIARREALARLRRPWFAGGTIQAVSALGDWYVPAEDESAFEDGTLNFLNIPDVSVGIRWVQDIGIDLIRQRVTCLTGWLLDRLTALRHTGGAPLVRLYGPLGTRGRGATVALNLLDPSGEVVDERAVARDASARRISLRTGCFCNPGAGEGAFSITKETLTGSVRHGSRSLDAYLELLGLPSGGAIRVSFGLASNLDDVDRFLQFAEETYCDRTPDYGGLLPRLRC